MPTECSATLMRFAPVEGRAVVAAFDGGAITSDAGALLLGATDRSIGLIERFAGCFTDGAGGGAGRVHEVATLVGQRVFGIALGLRGPRRPRPAAPRPGAGGGAGKLAARRGDCAPLAGKSTLNRLEHAPAGEPTATTGSPTTARRSRRCSWTCSSRRTATGRRRQIVLDLDATDDPVHGHQEGRFFHGYYDCLLLPAALRLLRPAPAGGQAQPRQHRRLGRRGRGGRADRRPDPRPLAAGCGSSCAPTAASPARR